MSCGGFKLRLMVVERGGEEEMEFLSSAAAMSYEGWSS